MEEKGYMMPPLLLKYSTVFPSCCIEHAAERGRAEKEILIKVFFHTLMAPMTLMTAALIPDLMTLLI